MVKSRKAKVGEEMWNGDGDVDDLERLLRCSVIMGHVGVAVTLFLQLQQSTVYLMHGHEKCQKAYGIVVRQA